jgi:hypothetical protein
VRASPSMSMFMNAGVQRLMITPVAAGCKRLSCRAAPRADPVPPFRLVEI